MKSINRYIIYVIIILMIIGGFYWYKHKSSYSTDCITECHEYDDYPGCLISCNKTERCIKLCKKNKVDSNKYDTCMQRCLTS